jgi:hypothetical protein
VRIRSLAVALFASSSVGVFAQTAPPVPGAAAANWKPSISLSAPRPAFKPYLVDWGARPPAAQAATPKPTVVCGMTLVPGDPKVDPKMRVAVPDRGVAHVMLGVPPTVCKTP